MRFGLQFALIQLCLCVVATASDTRLIVAPERVELHGQSSRQQLLVTRLVAERPRDVTHAAQYKSLTPDLCSVSSSGLVKAVADGEGRIAIDDGDQHVEVIVKVVRAAEPPPVSFELHIQPVLTRLGCNAGACHGKSRGQNGFSLSLLGFYPDFDYAALTQEARGRRVWTLAPEESLLLKKAAGLAPHGGGKRMEPDGTAYETLRRWISQGLPRAQPNDPTIARIAVTPTERVLGFDEPQQLAVTAYFSDGTSQDVTELAAFQSNESVIANVDHNGLIRSGPVPGEAAVMARFMGHIALCNVLVPVPGDVDPAIYANLPRNNFVDELVWAKQQRLGLIPSEPASDTTWLRRVHIDLIGRLPTPLEVRNFVADTDSQKRAKVVDQLLARPEYADHWANKWADLLRPNPYRVGIKAVFNLDQWLRDAFRQNIPYDQFVREIVTAQGSTWQNGAVTVFRDRRTPDEITPMISQIFLGVRLECAKCHHHPFEVYGQEHFYGFAAYFTRLGRKGVGISTPISGSEEVVFEGAPTTVTHPITGEVMKPSPLFGTAPEIAPDRDPREALAAWMTGPDNPYFARVIVNRVWADLMGRGLVEPVDDLRATNPPTNAALLDALAADFRAHGCDLKHLAKTITLSHVYSLSSLPSERNVGDTRNYSRHYRQRLRGETLLDAVSDITGLPERFNGVPPGSRAAEIWTHRTDSDFLDAFGRPDPNQDPPCERTGETTVIQVLHLLNSAQLQGKVTSEKGRIAELAKSMLAPAELIDETYLLLYSRFPTSEEREVALALFADPKNSRQTAMEDLVWCLINTAEFVFKD